MAAVYVNEVEGTRRQVAQNIGGETAFEFGAFPALGALDVGPEQRLVVAIEADQARPFRDRNIAEQPGAGAAFEAANLEDPARCAAQVLQVPPETRDVRGKPVGGESVADGILAGWRRVGRRGCGSGDARGAREFENVWRRGGLEKMFVNDLVEVAEEGIAIEGRWRGCAG